MQRPTTFPVASIEALETRTMLSATATDVHAAAPHATPAAYEVAAKHGGQNQQKHGNAKPAKPVKPAKPAKPPKAAKAPKPVKQPKVSDQPKDHGNPKK